MFTLQDYLSSPDQKIHKVAKAIHSKIKAVANKQNRELMASAIDSKSNFARDWAFEDSDIVELGQRIKKITGYAIKPMVEFSDDLYEMTIDKVMEYVSSANKI